MEDIEHHPDFFVGKCREYRQAIDLRKIQKSLESGNILIMEAYWILLQGAKRIGSTEARPKAELTRSDVRVAPMPKL
jgi:hypothetical protein